MSRQPVGPCLLVTPWNFPLAMATRKVAPALAAGCTVVLKPAAADAAHRARVRADHARRRAAARRPQRDHARPGAGAVVAPLLEDERLRKLSFTGSTAVGRRLIGQSADRVLRTSMELGGNAPFIVLDDADLDAAVDGALRRQDAQRRRVVHRRQPPVRPRVARGRVRRTARGADGRARRRARDRARRRGRPARSTPPSATRWPRWSTTRAPAVREVLCGGAAVDGPGYFYRPTVLVDPAPGRARSCARRSSGRSHRS